MDHYDSEEEEPLANRIMGQVRPPFTLDHHRVLACTLDERNDATLTFGFILCMYL